MKQVINSTDCFQATQNMLYLPPGLIKDTTDDDFKTANKHSLLNISQPRISNVPPGFENFNPKSRNFKSSTIQTND